MEWLKLPQELSDLSQAEELTEQETTPESIPETIPENSMITEVTEKVTEILENVKSKGDQSILHYTEKYDGVRLEKLTVDKEEVKKAYQQIDTETLDAVKKAAEHIEAFAQKQRLSLQPLEYEQIPGVVLGHRLVPLTRVGCYVPAGRYPLPSTALMSIIPAKVAGVSHVVACSPPSCEDGRMHPLVLAAMDIAGADEILTMGGAQAVAAYAYGTETVAPCSMIVGPGNKYVAEAKRQLSGVVGIDLLAGPSEVLIIADETADPRTVAVDLLANCEHDPDAASCLVTTSEKLAKEVMNLMEEELPQLATAEVIRESWLKNGEIVVCANDQEAIDLANQKAPEHLQLMTAKNDSVASGLINYGSLFIGEHAPVAFGDYCSGTNHILPTGKTARFTNGLWVGSFIKVLSYQKVTPQGARALSETCSLLAGKEGLWAHRRSSELRR